MTRLPNAVSSDDDLFDDFASDFVSQWHEAHSSSDIRVGDTVDVLAPESDTILYRADVVTVEGSDRLRLNNIRFPEETGQFISMPVVSPAQCRVAKRSTSR